MLDAASYEEIQRFLTLVNKPDLFAYLQVDREAPANKVKGALRRRRSWAQGQQANPKYRTEALWLIKNIQLVQIAVVDDRSDYLKEADDRVRQRAIQALRFFIQTTLVDGILRPEDESKILETAEELGVPAAEVPTHVELVLTALDQGMVQDSSEEELSSTKDHYTVLGADPTADQATLEAAYRERYRWARNLRDTEESSRIYADLDAAWRVLKDPERRAEYNAEAGLEPVREAAPASLEAPSSGEEPDQIGFLPPPTPLPKDEPPPAPIVPPITEPPAQNDALELPEMDIEDPEVELDILDPEEVLDIDIDAQDDDPLSQEPLQSTRPPAEDKKEAPPANEGPVLDIGEVRDEPLPSLEVGGPSTIRIRTGNNPFPVRITIRNTGLGQMSGSIHCEEDWVEISPRHLNPSRNEHSIEALVDPDKMPGNSARATIEISTGHGEKAEVVIDALKHLISPAMMVLAAAALVLLAIGGAAIYFFGEISATTEAPTRTILAVQVDPPAGEVFVDDVLVGKQGTLSLVNSFPVGKPFQVRVELDGFEPWTKEVQVTQGQQFRVEADLVLRDPMDFKITPQMQRSELDRSVLNEQLKHLDEQFRYCFTRNLQPDNAYTAALTVRGIVSQRGYVAAIEYRSANFESEEVRTCLRRQLRGVKVPVIPGDYATFDHTFRTRVSPLGAGVQGEEGSQ